MSTPSFATLERRLASSVTAAFCNRMLVKGGVQFKAVIDRAVLQVGEYSLTASRQDQLSVVIADAPALAVGDTVAMDPAYYTSAELAAEPKTSWIIDRKESDDGLVAQWWLR
ncbi:MAG: hypothetical protein ABFC67_07480 [Mizugakiibacter sp.]|uniref:hypothetical protein n=1 Tax=Mizugakiibacter sp. TaxID=1972610 RepID=UPI00320E8E5A